MTLKFVCLRGSLDGLDSSLDQVGIFIDPSYTRTFQILPSNIYKNETNHKLILTKQSLLCWIVEVTRFTESPKWFTNHFAMEFKCTFKLCNGTLLNIKKIMGSYHFKRQVSIWSCSPASDPIIIPSDSKNPFSTKQCNFQIAWHLQIQTMSICG